MLSPQLEGALGDDSVKPLGDWVKISSYMITIVYNLFLILVKYRQDFSAGGGGQVTGDGWRVTGDGWRVAG